MLNTNRWSCGGHSSVFQLPNNVCTLFYSQDKQCPTPLVSPLFDWYACKPECCCLVLATVVWQCPRPCEAILAYFAFHQCPSYLSNCHVTENALAFTLLSLFYPARYASKLWLVLTKSLPAEQLSPRRAPGLTSPVGKHLASQLTQKYATGDILHELDKPLTYITYRYLWLRFEDPRITPPWQPPKTCWRFLLIVQ